jgi:hypothetical protein
MPDDSISSPSCQISRNCGGYTHLKPGRAKTLRAFIAPLHDKYISNSRLDLSGAFHIISSMPSI